MKKTEYISIKQYLNDKGIAPTKDREYYGMYHSPFREDNNASMKVDFQKNLWYDFGLNEGGSIVDLVMKMEQCSLAKALQQLDDSFSFHRNEDTFYKKEPEQSTSVRVTDVLELSNEALLQFLRKRCIDIEIAQQYCKEVHYMVNEKPYYAIGLQNDTGGWALRNEYFKGCILSMGTTFFNAGNRPDAPKENCLLFEGFTDFLSYLVLKKSKHSDRDVIVLNSVSNIPKIKNTLSEYRTIYAFLDNDEAGKRAVQDLRSFCKNVHDQSIHYSGHKDLNDYLCSRSAPKQVVKKKPSRGMRM